MMNIALDAMGGDRAPQDIVAGAVDAAKEYGVTVSLVGKPDVIEAELKKYKIAGLNLPIVPASQVIEMDDKPAQAVRTKPDSSMVVGCKMVKRGEANAFVSAGNTGGAMTAGILHVGRVRGIMRPALIGPFPTVKGVTLILRHGRQCRRPARAHAAVCHHGPDVLADDHGHREPEHTHPLQRRGGR